MHGHNFALPRPDRGLGHLRTNAELIGHQARWPVWLRSHGLCCQSLPGEGNPAEAIEEFVEERAADLLVVGTSSRLGLGKMVLGSVKTDAGIAVPGSGGRPRCYNAGVGTNSQRRLSTDFSGASVRATRFASSAADECEAHLTMAHVLQGWSKDSLSVDPGDREADTRDDTP